MLHCTVHLESHMCMRVTCVCQGVVPQLPGLQVRLEKAFEVMCRIVYVCPAGQGMDLSDSTRL